MAKRIVAIDSQKLTAIQTCGYKFHLSFDRDLQAIEKEDYYERGDLMHRMLQTYYSMHKYQTRWPKDFTIARVKKTCERVAEHFAAFTMLPPDDVDNTIRTFRDYIDFYWGERPITLAVERSGAKVLYEDDNLIILYQVKVDWVVSTHNSPVLPVDHKTSSRRSETASLDNQFMGYCWFFDVNNLMVNKIGFQKTLKPIEKFSRPIMSYGAGVIEGWVKNSVWWIKEAVRYEETGFFPQNFTSCKKFDKPCKFTPICESSPELRNRTISEGFEKRESWDVGAGL